MSDVFTEPAQDNAAIATQHINNLGNLAHDFQNKTFELEDALTAANAKLDASIAHIAEQDKTIESQQLELLAAKETIANLQKQLEALAILAGQKVAEFVQ
jgi:peptidoglycan hydrolase CwlO-like protein